MKIINKEKANLEDKECREWLSKLNTKIKKMKQKTLTEKFGENPYILATLVLGLLVLGLNKIKDMQK